MKCNCGSESLVKTQFRQFGKSGFCIASTKTGIFSEVVILPEVWVCQGCRQILFSVKEEDMQYVQAIEE